MHGQTRARVKTEPQVIYVCKPDKSVVEAQGHPPSVYVNERDLVIAVDLALSEIYEPSTVDTIIAALPEARSGAMELPDITEARHRRRDVLLRIERLLDSIEAGVVDPADVAKRLKERQKEVAALDAYIDAAAKEHRTRDLAPLASALHSLRDYLIDPDPAARRSVYRGIDLHVSYGRDSGGNAAVSITVDAAIRASQLAIPVPKTK